jgi:hypothetical protein
VQGNQQWPTFAPGVVARQLNFVVAANGAAKEFFHKFRKISGVASFPPRDETRTGW